MTIWVGNYAAKGGKGLRPISLNDDILDLGEPETRIANASFGIWCPRHRIAYFVDEQEAGRVVAWRRDQGHWVEAGAVASGGSLPCYIALSHDRRSLAVANYGDGSVGLISLDPDNGAILHLGDVARQSGHGLDPERQGGPHAHCVVFSEDDRVLYHVDLGLDCVFSHDVEDGKFARREVAFRAPAGSGPRQLLLDPDRRHALLVTELSAEIFLLERQGAGFVATNSVSCAPVPDLSDNLGGYLALAPGGTILVTNRGHDSIVAFERDGHRLVRRDWKHTGGSSPRHFLGDAGSLLIAHEESGSISALSPPGEPGGEAIRATAALPGAAFVIEIPE